MPRPIGSGPAQCPRCVRANVAQFQQANRRFRVETEHAHVQDGLAIGRDRPLLGLDFRRRLLQESSHLAVAGKAEYAMPACLLRLGKAPQSAHAFAVPMDFVRVEPQQYVAGGDHDLPFALAARRQGQIGGQLAIEKRCSQGRVGEARERDEDLSARSIGRQAAGVAAGMDDENPQSLQDFLPCIRASNLSPRSPMFAREHLHQAANRASAAADAATAGVGHDDHLAQLP